jgi:hypothetical protein
MKGNAPLNTLKRQPGQSESYNPKFHPLPGPYAMSQMNGTDKRSSSHPTSSTRDQTQNFEINKARAAEAKVHEYWEEWQGVRPGKPVYENPRELQNTLLPSAKYGTEGPGYGS